MHILAAVVGIIFIAVILFDTFQTVVLPRRASSSLRITNLFYRFTWLIYSGPARRKPHSQRRENYLALYGPLSLFLLLSVWVVGLVLGFALLFWAAGSPLHAPENPPTFFTDLYTSGSTFFTLGLGDIIPATYLSRALFVIEVGTGFAFLALVIGYLPVLYQAFSRREVSISLLDARAGSPPTALELLRRCWEDDDCTMSVDFLHDWERWSAELLETHLSYPVLGFYRSQHENQSWLAALAAILDVSALISVGIEGVPRRQGRLTFAMARHTLVDLAQVFETPPAENGNNPDWDEQLQSLRFSMDRMGMTLRPGAQADEELAELHRLYQPYLTALSAYLLMPVSSWGNPLEHKDNWQSTAWGKM